MGLIDKIKSKIRRRKMPIFNVTALGGPGSGKTSYMHTLFKSLNDNSGGYSIQGTGAGDLTWTDVTSENGDRLYLPDRTTGIRKWSFQLNRGKRKICKFNWIDYSGKLVENLHKDDPDTVLLRDLMSISDGLILFVDSPSLFYYENDRNRKIASGIAKLMEIMGSFAIQDNNGSNGVDIPENRDLKAVSVVLSRADSDLLDDCVIRRDSIKGGKGSYVHDAYAGLIQAYLEQGQMLNKFLLSTNWPVAITPFGAFGHGRTVTKLKPFGEDNSLDDCVYEPDSKVGVPLGNKLGKYFDPFIAPTQQVEYATSNQTDNSIIPINALAPVLWIFDNLLLAGKYRDLNVVKPRKGILGQSWFSRDRVADLDEGDPSTVENFRQPVMVPLSRLYPKGW